MGEPWLGVGTVDHGTTLAGCVSSHRYVSWFMLKNKIRSRIKVKVMLCKGNVVRRHGMTACRAVEVLPHWALDRVEWSVKRPTPRPLYSRGRVSGSD